MQAIHIDKHIDDFKLRYGFDQANLHLLREILTYQIVLDIFERLSVRYSVFIQTFT